MRHRRNNFTKETKREAYHRACGPDGVPRCESIRVPVLASIGCNRVLRDGDINYHHILASALGGSNDLDNCAVLCRTCHAITTATNEQPVIAQDRRVADLARGIKPPSTLPGAKADPFKKTLSGLVVDRQTGEPWRGWR